MASTVTDLTAGVMFKTKNGFYAGISAPQILGNKIDLTDENVDNKDLVPHYYLMAGHRFNLTEKIELEPSILMKYTDAAPLQYDISGRAIFNNKFWVGGTYREGAAASGMVGCAITPIIELAYAYDVTFNEVKEASTGSHEITLGVKLGKPKDSDGDGIPDKEDECPDEPGIEELNGCPEPIASEEDVDDKDGDGVLDPFDECPYDPGPAKNQGCPEEGDRDKDGLVDSKDDCPDEYGLPIHKGCPFQDADGDLVADEFDKCPKTPGVAANDGCPQVTVAEKAILDLAIRNLYFDTNKSTIKPESFRFLDKLAELLEAQTHYKIKIEGHADSRGTDVHNLELSKERAFAVQTYLEERGVSANQLTLEYYGETKPMASNVKEDTRRFNRRVEMSFVWD